MCGERGRSGECIEREVCNCKGVSRERGVRTVFTYPWLVPYSPPQILSSIPLSFLPSPFILSYLPLLLPSLSPYRVLFWITKMGIFAKPLNNLVLTSECYTFSNLQAITVDSVNSRLFVAYFVGQELRVATLNYTTCTCDES